MVSILKFCANLNTLFQEKGSIFERYEAANKCGFSGVETLFPYEYDVSQLSESLQKNNLEQILINCFPGNRENGELGLAALPGREKDFINSLKTTFNYATALKCKRIHLMSGIVKESQREECLLTFKRNLSYTMQFLEENKIVGLLEPINNYTIPGYFLNDINLALKLIKMFDSPFLKLQLDLFHIQQIHGNLTKIIRENLSHIGHIQIAQVPKRNEPNEPGEINYDYIFNLLKNLGYSEWIGLEYMPTNGTIEGLNWMKKYV